MNVLFVPCLSLDLSLLNRLADSIDYPIRWKVAWNNGPEGALDQFRDEHPDWFVKDSPIGNRGCAGSWNECMKWFSSEPCWLLANEDCYFLPGQLKLICKCADNNPEEPIIYLNSSQAFYCFLLTQVGLRDFGDFDENFWPGYYEDCDYRVRMRLKGKTDYVYALEGERDPIVPHGKPRTGGTDYSALINGAGLLNRSYWHKKWGTDNHERAVYEFPYKDQRLTIKDWVWSPEHRAELYPLWRTFMEQPNPSIYD